MIQFEKGRMFNTATGRLYENDADGRIRENAKGRWFFDYAAAIPSREGWDAFLNFVQSLEGYRGTVTAVIDLPGEGEAVTPHVRCRVFDEPGGRVVRTYNVGHELKLIVANEQAWRRGNALVNL